MPALTASTTAARLPDGVTFVQNLGAEDVYVDTIAEISNSTGVKLVANGTLVLSHRKRYWIKASATTADIRFG